ncbi:glycoside hydrolase family protein [Venturia nashicola]|uniref:cellulase n=1 Tax=Venturia nashicola TaxID=86259 RepID=A0A4Z1PNP2_9PEZI|nr:glycoside hydrolase family 5 protein [Venturia nashicola]TLD36540.1 glycoside hydrolase family protein [Venturia nashicola]
MLSLLFNLLVFSHAINASYYPPPPKVSFAGTNLAGFDFGNKEDGSVVASEIVELTGPSHGTAPPVVAQLDHFIAQGLNTFRLPVAWQYLVNYQLDGHLDASGNFGMYDRLVRACLDAGAAMCIIDVHNYARWNGNIVGQSGSGFDKPENRHLCSLWWQLAAWYKDEKRVAFDIMNEPHTLDMEMWVETVQWAVNSIRSATGSNEHIILLPGTDFCSAGSYVQGNSKTLLEVKNPDGGTENLIFNIHKYLDYDGSGKNFECTTNNIDSTFAPLATWLRTNKRRAMLTETGGGSSAQSCMKYFCEQNEFIIANADVYLGVVGWGAGGFDPNWIPRYNLTETPVQTGNKLYDQELMKNCIIGKFRGVTGLGNYVAP